MDADSRKIIKNNVLRCETVLELVDLGFQLIVTKIFSVFNTLITINAGFVLLLITSLINCSRTMGWRLSRVFALSPASFLGSL